MFAPALTNVRRVCPFLFLIGALVFLSSSGFAVQYSSRVWQTDDGLPQNSVQAITQTRDGYLWIGTQDGLCRFDGVRFTVFDDTLAPQIKGRWFSALCQTSDGALWIGTDGKGLFRVKDKSIVHFSRTNGLAGDSVRTIYESRDATIWIGTGGGLSRFADGKFTTFTKTNGLTHDVIRSICEDGQGTYWIATGEGLNQMKDGAVTAAFQYNPKGKSPLPHNSMRCVLVDRKGVLWIGSNGGLTQFENENFKNFTQQDGLLDLTVSALCEDRSGNLWIGTYGGLHRLVDGKPVPEQTETGTIYDAIYSIFEDSEGNIWIGTNAGLHRLKPRRFTSLTKQEGLSHNSTVSVFVDKNESLWIGTWGGALNELRDGKIKVREASSGLPFYFVLALSQSRDGKLWAGTDYDMGLFRFDPNGGVSRWGKEHGFPDAAISVIYEDRENNVWVGTRTALVRWKDEKFNRFTTQDGLPSNSIKAITEDRDGRLWIGTVDGLALRKADRFEGISSENGLSTNSICALHADEDGSLWIGTRGGGLNKLVQGSKLNVQSRKDPTEPTLNFEPGTLNFSSYTTKDGLFSDHVFEILEDDGFLWMTSAKGIFRVSKRNISEFDSGKIKALHCISYDKADGMISVDCKGVAKPSIAKTKDGRLWFATGKGLVSTDADLKTNDRPPPVFIERIVADRTSVLQPAFFPAPQNELRIPPGRGDLEIHYTALSFQSPEKNRFRYKLDGVDKEWRDAGSHRVAYYNHLAPGTYAFRVMACNNDGVWNETGAQFAVNLLPHAWQTLWFKLGIAGVVVAGLGGIYRLRITRLREIEKLRVRIAGDLHDEIGSSLWSISLLSRMLHKSAGLTDDDKRDASEINRIAVQTANSIRDIVWFINPDYDTLQDLLLRMRDVSNTMLGGVEHRFQMPQENLARKLPLDFRQNVFLMFKEILANIVKHSQATCVEIKIFAGDRDWEMTIRDNGAGFDTTRAASGNGLQNLRRRSEKLNGRLRIKSQPGSGTEIVFSMRLD